MRALPPARLSLSAAAPQAFPPRCSLVLTATSPPTTRGTPRRALLRSAAALAPLLLTALSPLPPPASAFENRLPPDEVELKYKSPRTAGPKPTDLGPQPDGGLKPCVDGKPVLFVFVSHSHPFFPHATPPSSHISPPHFLEQLTVCPLTLTPISPIRRTPTLSLPCILCFVCSTASQRRERLLRMRSCSMRIMGRRPSGW